MSENANPTLPSADTPSPASADVNADESSAVPSPTVPLSPEAAGEGEREGSTAKPLGGFVLLDPVTLEAAFELTGEKVLVGRVAEADIRLDDSKVSSKHCHFIRVADSYRIVDLDSRNGVRLNNRSVETAKLSNGDLIQIGPRKFFFHRLGETKPLAMSEAAARKTADDDEKPEPLPDASGSGVHIAITPADTPPILPDTPSDPGTSSPAPPLAAAAPAAPSATPAAPETPAPVAPATASESEAVASSPSPSVPQPFFGVVPGEADERKRSSSGRNKRTVSDRKRRPKPVSLAGEILAAIPLTMLVVGLGSFALGLYFYLSTPLPEFAAEPPTVIHRDTHELEALRSRVRQLQRNIDDMRTRREKLDEELQNPLYLGAQNRLDMQAQQINDIVTAMDAIEAQFTGLLNNLDRLEAKTGAGESAPPNRSNE